MYTIKLTISYDGTGYKGWQVQSNGNTIQAEIEKAVLKVFGRRHRVHSAGRTDAGVHAMGQVAHFKTPLYIPAKKVPVALNSVLPQDIAVVKARYMKNNFHARFDSISKLYVYKILNSPGRDPFSERFAWRVPYILDLKAMKAEAAVLAGRHDFRSFQAADKKERSSVRNIHRISLTRRKGFIFMRIRADGFLYNMVRNIAGTLVDVGRGYLPAGSMKKILAAKDRKHAGPTAPAKGLTLLSVKY